VDTNVWAVADERSGASLDCVERAQEWLRKLLSDAVLVVDGELRILQEYRNNISRQGLWARMLQELQGSGRIFWVDIECDEDGYAIVTDLNLPAAFDPSDRKFVAVACADRSRPPIVNCVDTDWLMVERVLEAAGIDLVQLCKVDLQAMASRKGLSWHPK